MAELRNNPVSPRQHDTNLLVINEALGAAVQLDGGSAGQQISGAVEVSGAFVVENGENPTLSVISTATTARVQLRDGGSGTPRNWNIRNNAGQFDVRDVTAGANRISVDSSGRVALGATPAADAHLEIVSTTGGLLLPRMTSTQRDAISSPRDGLLIYNSTTSKVQARAGGAWVDLH